LNLWEKRALDRFFKSVSQNQPGFGKRSIFTIFFLKKKISLVIAAFIVCNRILWVVFFMPDAVSKLQFL
jgi:hypothetical protein